MFGGENINKKIVGGMVLLALVLVAGGFAVISNDNSPQVINNPVSNEITDSNNLSSEGSIAISDVVKDIQQGVFVRAASAIVKDNMDVQSGVLVQENNGVAKTNNDGAFNLIFINLDFANVKSTAGEETYHDLSKGYAYMPGEFAMLQRNVDKSQYVLSPYYNSSIFVKIDQDFTDKYALCVDGEFIPLGNITKPIENIPICDLSCEVETYCILGPYIYDFDEVRYYLENYTFPEDTLLKQTQYEKDSINSFFSNYAALSGQKGIFVNIHQDYTDKYLQCVCGRFYALGNVTAPLDEIMLCDYPTHFDLDTYVDADSHAVFSRDDTYDSWSDDLNEQYSNPDYHPVHPDEIEHDVVSQSSTDQVPLTDIEATTYGYIEEI